MLTFLAKKLFCTNTLWQNKDYDDHDVKFDKLTWNRETVGKRCILTAPSCHYIPHIYSPWLHIKILMEAST